MDSEDFDKLIDRCVKSLAECVYESDDGEKIIRFETAVKTLTDILLDEKRQQMLEGNWCTDFWDVNINDY